MKLIKMGADAWDCKWSEERILSEKVLGLCEIHTGLLSRFGLC